MHMLTGVGHHRVPLLSQFRHLRLADVDAFILQPSECVACSESVVM